MQQFVCRVVAEHFLKRRIDEEEFADEIGAVDSVGGILDDGAEARFGAAQGFSGALAIGDVAIHDYQVRWFASGIANDAGSGLEYAPSTVSVTHAVLARTAASCA